MSDTKTNETANTGGSLTFFNKLRVKMVKLIAPDGLGKKELGYLLGLDLDVLNTQIQTLTEQVAIANTAIDFVNLPAYKLLAIVTANATLDDLQKSQISLILDPKAAKDLSYIK